LRETTVGNAASAFAGKAVAASITTLAKGATAMSGVTKLGIGGGVLAVIAVIGVAVAANFPKEKQAPVVVVPTPTPPTEPTKPVEPPKVVEPVKPVEPSVPVSPATEWVTLKGRVRLTAAPEPKKIDPSADKEHCLKDGPLVDSALIVNPKSKGVKNVVVWLRPDSTDRKERFPQAKIHPDLLTPKAKHHVIDQPCCQFEPRILAARVGDTLEVKNSAPVAHNINFSSDAEQFNVTMQPGTSRKSDRTLELQTAPILFKCDIHPWMQGRVRVFDHPYFAITDDDGNFEIKNIPAGKWRIVYWHEGGFHKGRDGLLGFPVEATGATTELPAIELELPK
jgi:plastocyanin